MRLPTLLSILCLAGCPWEAPVSDNPLSAAGLLNTISGTVVFAGDTPVDHTYVLVYSAANPGPPEGTGRPITFSAVPARKYTGTGAGLQSAPYAVTQLPDGAYTLSAVVDRDHDFSPLAGALAGATCGDWGGRHITDLVTLGTAQVTVSGGQVQDDVTIFVGQEFTIERPSFEFAGPAPELSKATAIGLLPPTYRLRSTGVAAAFGEDVLLASAPACEPEGDLPPGACESAAACPCEIDPLDPCAPAFYVWMVDDDLDGEVDPYPADLQAANGILNVWPRIFIESLDDTLGTFEYEGRTLPERWVGENYPLAVEIALAEIGGGSASDLGPVGLPFPASELNITLSPVFRHYHAGGTFDADINGPYDLIDLREAGADLTVVPEGAWSLTMISFTGQTWVMPNEIGLVPLPSLDEAFDPATQAAVLTIAP